MVDGFITEQNDISKLGNLTLLLPGHSETEPGIFLRPEGVEKGKNNLPPGELILDGHFQVDLFSVSVS